MKEFEGKLIILSAPSGSGKTTLVKHLLSTRKDLVFSISCTTREKRAGEIDNNDYYFLTKEEFVNRIDNKDFAEYEEVYNDIFYGTLNTEITRIWKEKKHAIFDVDVIGGLSIKEKHPDALAIFIKAPNLEVIEERLRLRATEAEEKVQQRLLKVKEEFIVESKFDVSIENNDLDKAKSDISTLVENYLKG